MAIISSSAGPQRDVAARGRRIVSGIIAASTRDFHLVWFPYIASSSILGDWDVATYRSSLDY
jgi:hypothetical protein